jgi:hypothetical protein
MVWQLPGAEGTGRIWCSALGSALFAWIVRRRPAWCGVVAMCCTPRVLRKVLQRQEQEGEEQND